MRGKKNMWARRGTPRRLPRQAATLTALLLAGTGSGCTELPADLGSPKLSPLSATVRLVDEDGAPVVGVLHLGGQEFPTDASGRLTLTDLQEGGAFRASASGYLDEPVLVGRSEREVRVTMFRAAGRSSFHFGGDYMMGRRYETGRDEKTPPLVRVEERASDARQVVSDLAPLFSLADLSIINFESIISTLPVEAAYPNKLFLIQSHPDTLSSLDELGVDAVILANNHIRDWMDQGIADTVAALDQIGMKHVGAGMNQDEARAPVAFEHAGRRVEMLAYAGLSGDIVNDNFPTEAEPIPADLPPDEAFKYERRPFFFESERVSLPRENLIAGQAWELFRAFDPSLTVDERAAFWSAVQAVYPELQDWVARRGHGGANQWRGRAATDIAEAKARADMVIVQIHAGFQFQSAPPGVLRQMTHDAIDAGADLVVTHHPHVLQGAEWYRGKLILFSLGNFAFDQNFHATYPSAFVRVIWDDSGLVAARLVPFEIQDYRPVPVVGSAAKRVMSQAMEASLVPSFSYRDAEDGRVRVALASRDPESTPARLSLLEHGVFLEPSGEPVETPVEVPAGATVGLAPGYWELQETVAGISVGRDLFGWGHFEDPLLDGSSEIVGHTTIEGDDRAVVSAADAPEGERYLRMRRAVNNASDLLWRPISRLPVPGTRIVGDAGADAGQALDGSPSYSLRMWARLRGRGRTTIRLRVDNYFFDDSRANEDPISELLGQQVYTIEVPDDGAWHQVEVPFQPDPGDSEREVTMILPYIIMSPTDRYDAVLDLDAVEFIEWREASRLPSGGAPSLMGALEYLRNQGSTGSQVPMRHLGFEPASP